MFKKLLKKYNSVTNNNAVMILLLESYFSIACIVMAFMISHWIRYVMLPIAFVGFLDSLFTIVPALLKWEKEEKEETKEDE